MDTEALEMEDLFVEQVDIYKIFCNTLYTFETLNKYQIKNSHRSATTQTTRHSCSTYANHCGRCINNDVGEHSETIAATNHCGNNAISAHRNIERRHGSSVCRRRRRSNLRHRIGVIVVGIIGGRLGEQQSPVVQCRRNGNAGGTLFASDDADSGRSAPQCGFETDEWWKC